MLWTAIITLSVLMTAQPEYDGALWRVYPGNQRYFYKNADAAIAMKIPTSQQEAKSEMKIQTPQQEAKAEGNTTPLPVVKAPVKKVPVKPDTIKSPSFESSFLRGLKQQIAKQQEAKTVVSTPSPVRQKAIVTPSPVELKKDIVIEYKMNRSRLTANQKQEIAAHLDTCRQADQIRIDSYADMTGSAQYNKLLTDKRAKEVEKALVTLGIEPNKITTRGLGQTNILPKGKNSRRTEIWLKGGESKK